jgi:hypothetical protein
MSYLDSLGSTNAKLLAWFESRPMQQVTAEMLRESSLEIWATPMKDAPRSARKLWELGFLERKNGTKDPYWFDPGIDHQTKGIERQRILCEQALASIATRLDRISKFVLAPEGFKPDQIQLGEFVVTTRAALKKLKLSGTDRKRSNI